MFPRVWESLCFKAFGRDGTESEGAHRPREATASFGPTPGSSIFAHDSARVCPAHFRPLKSEGCRGEYRVRANPAVSCAKVAQKKAQRPTGSAENTPGLPQRNGFTAYSALSPGETVVFLPPSPVKKRLLLTNLTPASGRQNHTTRRPLHAPVRQKRIASPHPTARSERSRGRPSCEVRRAN